MEPTRPRRRRHLLSPRSQILGTAKDYYILEAEFETLPPPTAAVDGAVPVEAPGTGLNKSAYFVANDVSQDFTLLADVTPAQAGGARSSLHNTPRVQRTRMPSHRR